MKHPFRWLWLVVAALTVAACGAGAGSTTTDKEPAAVVDREVTSESPSASQPDATSQLDHQEAFSPATSIGEASAERPVDYAKGGASPVLTVIEYGDFQ